VLSGLKPISSLAETAGCVKMNELA
jgi:hypothetical protein